MVDELKVIRIFHVQSGLATQTQFFAEYLAQVPYFKNAQFRSTFIILEYRCQIEWLSPIQH